MKPTLKRLFMINEMRWGRIIGIALVGIFFCAGSVTAQKAERQLVREGNKLYYNDNFAEAEKAYQKSIEVNPRSTEGAYNLGNALYNQEKYPEALEQYQLIAGQGERLLREDPNNTERLAHAFHNLGNIGMKSQQYEQSIEAFKQSLRLNPTDDETRYNLALAQKMLQDQQQEQQDQEQDQEQDQNQDQNQDQDQDQDQNQDQNQDQQEQDQQEQEQQQQQQQSEQISRENAQRILDAFQQDEKETQEKVRQFQMQQQQSRRREKQW